MIGHDRVDMLVASAPVNEFNSAKMNWGGFAEALSVSGLNPDSVVAATWCSFGERNIEAEIDSTQLTLIHPNGIFSSSGSRRLIGKAVKFDTIDFSLVRGYGPADTADERGFGKYCLEFAGAGGLLLGRLQWRWSTTRFRDNRDRVMAIAEERDRISSVVSDLLEGPSAHDLEVPTPAESSSSADELERLPGIHQRGVLGADEFTAAKRKALGI